MPARWAYSKHRIPVSMGTDESTAQALLEVDNAINKLVTELNDGSSITQRITTTFANLPTTKTVGATACITDCNTSGFGAVAAGGGTVVAEVFWNGTNWKVKGS